MPQSLSQGLEFSEWLQVFCQESTNLYVRDSEQIISYCFELDKKIRKEYSWCFSSVESMQQRVSTLTSPLEINQIYWTDQARNAEAYAIMTFWRGIELLEPAIRSLNVKEFIAPAVLSRSFIELASTFIWNANMIEKTFNELSFPEDSIVISSEFEEEIVKAIFGTRLGEPEPHVKQTNILTTLNKIAKHPSNQDILPLYNYLCEIAHPNVIGNTRFWSHIEKINPDGSEQLILHKHAYQKTEHLTEIIEKILYALSWSSVCLRNSFEINSRAIKNLILKLNS